MKQYGKNNYGNHPQIMHIVIIRVLVPDYERNKKQ